MTRITFLTASILLATTLTSAAHETKGTIDAREQRQLGAIEQGREDGSITWREGLQLRAEQKRIADSEAARVSDHGSLTPRDRREIAVAQQEAAEHIKTEKTDGWRRPWWLPRIGR